jgi:hypothetical protein
MIFRSSSVIVKSLFYQLLVLVVSDHITYLRIAMFQVFKVLAHRALVYESKILMSAKLHRRPIHILVCVFMPSGHCPHVDREAGIYCPMDNSRNLCLSVLRREVGDR